MVLMENDNRMASRIHGRLGDNTVAGSMADRPDLKGWI